MSNESINDQLWQSGNNHSLDKVLCCWIVDNIIGKLMSITWSRYDVTLIWTLSANHRVPSFHVIHFVLGAFQTRYQPENPRRLITAPQWLNKKQLRTFNNGLINLLFIFDESVHKSYVTRSVPLIPRKKKSKSTDVCRVWFSISYFVLPQRV